MTETTSLAEIAGYVPGTWTIDPTHSDVSFTVRHMMVSKVRGFFRTFEGKLVTGEVPENGSVTASIQLDSIATNNDQRDAHIRSADFFEVEKYPTMTYQSTRIARDGDDWVLEGELTLKGVTRPVPLKLEVTGFGPDAYGGYRAGFSAAGEINRHDFNVSFNATLDNGGLVVGDKVTILLEIEAVLDKSEG
jgi:polyisoprenoid-binding protein YceI